MSFHLIIYLGSSGNHTGVKIQARSSVVRAEHWCKENGVSFSIVIHVHFHTVKMSQKSPKRGKNPSLQGCGKSMDCDKIHTIELAKTMV